MEQRDYTRLVPFTPPEALERWTLEHAEELRKDVLVYKKEPVYGPACVSVWCSACGETSYANYRPKGAACCHYQGPAYTFWWNEGENLHDGVEAACPYCGKRCTVRHAGSVGWLGTAWPMTMCRIEGAEENGLDSSTSPSATLRMTAREAQIAIVWWSVRREVVRIAGGYDVNVEVHPYEAYVVEKRKLVRLKGYWKGIGYAFSWLGGWQQMKSMNDTCGTAELVCPWDPRLLEGTTAENSKLDLYLNTGADCRPVQYLNNWIKKPQVENLIVQGLGHLYNSLLEYHRGYSCQGKITYSWKNIKEIDWKQRSPARMLSVNRLELRLLRDHHWGARELLMMKTLREHGYRLKPEELAVCAAFGPDGVRDMAENGLPVMKCVRYINKQRRKYTAELPRIGVSHLEDYWRLAKKAGVTLATEAERWPQHLTAAHDAMLRRVKWQESKELVEKFRAQFARLSAFSFAAGGLLIRPVQDESELIAEGKSLHHCVATYAKTHAEGERVILLIRREEEPERPFFTLNLNTKTLTVIQNHGLQNCGPTQEVKAFVEVWLEHIHNLNRRKTA